VARQRITFQRLMDGLRAIIRQYGGGRARFHLKDGSFGGDAPVKELSWPEVRSIIYKDHGE